MPHSNHHQASAVETPAGRAGRNLENIRVDLNKVKPRGSGYLRRHINGRQLAEKVGLRTN